MLTFLPRRSHYFQTSDCLSNYKFNTTEKRSELMRKIRSTNTKPEQALRKELWKRGYRYRLYVKGLKGKPDIVIKKYKLVVFIDGEFWHGYKWEEKKPKIKANREYWVRKIERNIERDKENTTHLISQGYTVLRFWEHEIRKDIESCVKQIIYSITCNRKNQT